ncbi:hypothetical protein ABZ778_29750 [Streptomyces bacillaris]|uniref:hypothetical protein n=1 Tax=Streptomyces bacillaris TaxID=68179 RepID=UPI00346020CC
MTALSEAPTHSVPGIVLPAALRAFHTLQEPAYRAYTEAHTTPADSSLVLGRAFGELAAHWSQIMLRTDPAAYAWDLFTATVHASVGRLAIPATSRLQYEAVVLHHITGCTIHRTSETTGRPPEKIRHLLRTWECEQMAGRTPGRTGQVSPPRALDVTEK